MIALAAWLAFEPLRSLAYRLALSLAEMPLPLLGALCAAWSIPLAACSLGCLARARRWRARAGARADLAPLGAAGARRRQARALAGAAAWAALAAAAWFLEHRGEAWLGEPGARAALLCSGLASLLAAWPCLDALVESWDEESPASARFGPGAGERLALSAALAADAERQGLEQEASAGARDRGAPRL